MVSQHPMRKLLHMSLVLSLGVTACKGASNMRKLYQAGDPCLDDDTFELIIEGECTYEELSLAVAGRLISLGSPCSFNDADEEIIALLSATDEDEARTIVYDLCADAITDQVFKKDSFDFDRFSGHDYEFNKAFFDGQSSWNDGGTTWKKALNPPTSNGDASDEFHGSSKVVSGVYDKHAMKRQMTWPDNYENFDQCNLNAAMCCWVDHDATLDPRFVKNTDICYVDNTRAPSSNHIDAGFSIYGGINGDEDAFCHGFAWEDGSLDDTFKGNLLFISEIYENMHNHGLSNNVPGAPMCGCLEKMPVVTRADCSMLEYTGKFVYKHSPLTNSIDAKGVTINSIECNDGNGNITDLQEYYHMLHDEGKVDGLQKSHFDEIIVGDGNCASAIFTFMNDWYNTHDPTHQPSSSPSASPSVSPSNQPSDVPSQNPSTSPSVSPSTSPSSKPSDVPSDSPSLSPSDSPSSSPSTSPSSSPSSQPSDSPSESPSLSPSDSPSSSPSASPSSSPSSQPSDSPSGSPSLSPSDSPSSSPSASPSSSPSSQPSDSPSESPSSSPSDSPSSSPSASPSTSPSGQPSDAPSESPSSSPSDSSSSPSASPSTSPSSQPSDAPSDSPSSSPSDSPSSSPSASPSTSPSSQPSAAPSDSPSSSPSVLPSASPSASPSTSPSGQPSDAPSDSPSLSPSDSPSASPSGSPSTSPSNQPSTSPSDSPSTSPSSQPSDAPTESPSSHPSSQPSSMPSESPSSQPSLAPSTFPSSSPSESPSSHPSSQPSSQPSSMPSESPSLQPSLAPSTSPSSSPSDPPSWSPSSTPSDAPSGYPSSMPSDAPSASPSSSPSDSPSVSPSTSSPTSMPSDAPSQQPTFCDFPNAQKIKVQSTTPEQIAMFEFQVFSSSINGIPENVALGMNAHQSTNLVDSGVVQFANKAVDGDITSYSHTRSGAAFWEVDLGAMTDLESITIMNRWCTDPSDPDGCLCKLSSATITLLDTFNTVVTQYSLGDTCGQSQIDLDLEVCS